MRITDMPAAAQKAAADWLTPSDKHMVAHVQQAPDAYMVIGHRADRQYDAVFVFTLGGPWVVSVDVAGGTAQDVLNALEMRGSM